mmetsp:Transcript_5098/g.7879  ORF Transcript_5098/g.7879 Transcript_5098/m.7879 type:complete len:82 (-) Transcript_5098:803-1048(-)
MGFLFESKISMERMEQGTRLALVILRVSTIHYHDVAPSKEDLLETSHWFVYNNNIVATGGWIGECLFLFLLFGTSRLSSGN